MNKMMLEEDNNSVQISDDELINNTNKQDINEFKYV